MFVVNVGFFSYFYEGLKRYRNETQARVFRLPYNVMLNLSVNSTAVGDLFYLNTTIGDELLSLLILLAKCSLKTCYKTTKPKPLKTAQKITKFSATLLGFKFCCKTIVCIFSAALLGFQILM